jgi:hypothetical protein
MTSPGPTPAKQTASLPGAGTEDPRWTLTRVRPIQDAPDHDGEQTCFSANNLFVNRDQASYANLLVRESLDLFDCSPEVVVGIRRKCILIEVRFAILGVIISFDGLLCFI